MRLIDADALFNEIKTREDESDMPALWYNGVAFARWFIFHAPTIEAEPVVRCKECKHSQYDELFHMRGCNGEEVKDDDFCSYGERKDDER